MDNTLAKDVENAMVQTVANRIREKASVTDMGRILKDGGLEVFATKVEINLRATVETPADSDYRSDMNLVRDIDVNSCILSLAAMLLGVTEPNDG